ncbi:hypothetical protein K461DRAFT_101093 [Myriangium duriaei CBS 260.36]|uniref:SAP domain-containing protein n=1 Tax=Myriangium duriaei CBS 260.36 TaxID=1168546 RepID=A0A9P4J7S5_9PEZI|nr:hypothetical protein K461DRAFT_101093 [Myriangium duriaei CBS 260.36]
MTDYAKMKNADLEALLKDRGLPHTGKKAELVKRLQEADASASATKEDEIDWDDEPTGATTIAPAAEVATEATSAPAAAAIAAGGTGQPPNPQAVPNQKPDEVDPSTTHDLTVAAAPEDTSAEPTPAPAEPAKDFTIGLAPTTLDEEIAKRRARAKKFGTDPEGDETLKALERAKRFGASQVADKLDQALPEKRERKRGREGGADDAEARKRGRQGRAGKGDAPAKPAPAAVQGKKQGPGAAWMTDADRAKAEARKAKFATAS